MLWGSMQQWVHKIQVFKLIRIRGLHPCIQEQPTTNCSVSKEWVSLSVFGSDKLWPISSSAAHKTLFRKWTQRCFKMEIARQRSLLICLSRTRVSIDSMYAKVGVTIMILTCLRRARKYKVHPRTMADGHDAESLRPPELKRQKLMSKEETASLRKEYIA